MKSPLSLIWGSILGPLGGGLISMGLIVVGAELIPAPPGIDVTDSQSLRDGAHLLGPQHFLFPFLAHAAGIVNSFLIPALLWFIAAGLAFAYLPMALVGARLMKRLGVTTRSST